MEPVEIEPHPNFPHHGGGTVPPPPRRQVSNITLPKKKSPVAGACSNLVNSIVGAGIIGIPFALKESGLVAGTILLILVSYFTDKTLRMLVELASFSPRLKDYGVLTFEDLLSLPFGRAGTVFVLTSMFITAYGAMVAYLLIIKDTLPVIFGLEETPGAGSFIERELLMVGTSLAVVVPLSMQRDFSSLAFTSSISVTADVFLVVFVAVFAPVASSVASAGGLGRILQENWINGGFFIGFGVLTIAMTCQHSAFIVAGSLRNLTASRWARVTCISLTLSAILCLVLGISGYLGFLDQTQGDVLNNFAVDTFQANAARGLLALTMFFTYPMEAFVARHVLIQLLFGGDMDGYVTLTDPTTGEFTTTKSKRCGCLNRRYQVTFIIYITTLIPALLVDDLGPVLSITGAIGGCCLAYIGPGLAYLGVHGDDFLESVTGSLQSRSKPSSTKTSESDLPLEGDATANIQTPTNPTYPSELVGPKPWWWWPTLMPLWVAIATKGATGMNDRLTAFDSEHGPVSAAQEGGNGETSRVEDGSIHEAIEPCKRDYIFSIFFIVFGVVAMVAGILSNVYVQVNNIFYTPT
ncbi:transmembrane amino acid transporter [Nitzschia inconspicua]|uniref:Transmembrane amino acid transporter n=1 Tax=Nitzschia inconspicua TaxID=303405 RepID=A0A9K3KD58_9STRA|nr:transmembrane amino acid transporter [Nitzschia inconspicua]